MNSFIVSFKHFSFISTQMTIEFRVRKRLANNLPIPDAIKNIK